MTIHEAYPLLKEGYLLRRDSWGNPYFYIYQTGAIVFDCNDTEYNIWHSDKGANDWKILRKMGWFEKYRNKRRLLKKYKKLLGFKG